MKKPITLRKAKALLLQREADIASMQATHHREICQQVADLHEAEREIKHLKQRIECAEEREMRAERRLHDLRATVGHYFGILSNPTLNAQKDAVAAALSEIFYPRYDTAIRPDDWKAICFK